MNKIENKISKRKLKKLHELFLKTDLIKNKISSIRNDAIWNNFKVVKLNLLNLIGWKYWHS